MKKAFKLILAFIAVGGGLTLSASLPLHNASAEDNENIEKVWEVNEDPDDNIATDPILNASDLKKTNDGGFIIAGRGPETYDPDQHVGFNYVASLFKYDTDGNREWKAMHQNDPLGQDSYFTSVVQISNNEYMAVGYHNNPSNSSDGKTGIISKFTINGNTATETETWHLRYESKKTFLTAIVLDDDGNFVISGMTDAKLFYFKLKSSHACSIAADNICDEDIAWKVDYEDAYASTTIDTTTDSPLYYVNRVRKIDAGEFLIFDKIGSSGGSIVKITELETGDSVSQVKNEFTVSGIGVESALDNEYLWFGKPLSGTSYINYWNFGNTFSERDLKGGRYFVPVSANYTNPSGSYVAGLRAIPTVDNQYLVLGEYVANYHGGADLLKVDSNRKILWEHRDDTSSVDNYWMAGDSMGDGTYVVVSNTGMIRKYRDKTAYNWIRYNIVGETDPEYVDLYAMVGQNAGDAHYYMSACQRPGRVSVKNGGTFTLNTIYSNGCNFYGSNPYTGFEFSGWYTDPSLDPATKIDDSFDLTANRNIELYGSYEKQEFQIPFYVLTDEDDGNEPTVTENSVQTLEVYDMVHLPEIEVPEGYAFDGWYDGKIVDGERVYNTENKHTEDFAYVFTHASPNSSDHFDFLYAKVTKKKTFEIPFYTVTYEEEGGTPIAVADSVQSGYVGDTITLPTVEVSEDYEMKGWFGGNIVDGEPVYNTTKQFTEDFVYSESEVGQYDFIYAKIVKKPVYHVPFYLVVYEDTNYTTIKEVVEIEGAKNDYRIGDYLEFPNFNTTTKYSRQNYYWYGGKVVDGEKVYNSSPSLYERTNYYTYTQNYVTQFDFLYTRVTLQSISVHFSIKDDYSYYDNNGNWTQAHYCGDYSSEMTTYPDETISWGGTITTEIKTASPDGSCVLGSLKLTDSSSIDYTPDMPIEPSYYVLVSIEGKYIPNYLVVRDDKVYYASGEEYDVEADENLFWDPETNTLTLENYATMDILFNNGEEPINLVLNGTNDTQIRSSTTPIVISGTGSLANATPLQGSSNTAYAAIDANGTSIVMESGKIEDNIFADNVMINGGEVSEAINVCPTWIYGYDYDGTSCGVVVNGGKVYSIYANYGDINIYDGSFRSGSGIDARDGDLVIENGIFNSSSFEGDRIIINGGSISGMSNVETGVFMMNGGNIDVTIPDRFRVEDYFIMNDGVLKVKAVSEAPAIYVRNGYAIFNGGTADIAGVVPMVVEYPGAFEEELAAAGMELNEETIAELKARLGDYLPTRGAGVEINGGDVTFGTVKKDELIDLAVDAYMAGFEEDMMSYMPSTDEEVAEICLDAVEGDMMFAHYKTWRIDISGLTLVPMDDGEGGQVMLPELDMNTGDALIDEEGNPIFIPLYNAVDGEGNVVYSKVGQGVDENGNTFYFKAGFSDENDCKNNFLTVYPDLMRLYYRDYLRQEAEEDYADVEAYPMAFMLQKNGSDGVIDESAIYINPELFKDPEVIEISPITVSVEDSTQYFVTFGDGEGEPSFDPEALTSEHVLMKARFYEGAFYTVTWENEDGTVLETDENVAEGEMPSFDGETLTKETTPKYQYEFIGWSPDDGTTVYPKDEPLPVVQGDITYKPVFDKQEYTPEYEWIENQEYTVGEDNVAAFRVDIARKFFSQKVKVDGAEITRGSDYEAVEGSTIIVLGSQYLGSLTEGEHTMKVYFDEPTEDEDVVIATTFTIKKKEVPPVPATDDIATSNTGFKPAEQSSNTSAATATILLAVIASSVYMIGRRILRRK